MRLFWILLVISIFSIIFGELVRIDLGNNVFLKPLDMILSLTAMSYLCYKIVKHQSFPKTKITKPLFIFIGTALLSLLTNSVYLEAEQFLTAFLYWFRFVSFAFIYFLILDLDKKKLKKIPQLLFISGFVVLLGGIIQYVFYPNLRNLYYLGWDEHVYRLFSSFLDPNFTGAFLVLFLLFVLVDKNKNKYLLMSIIALSVLAIALTYSRSALLMLFAGVATYLYLTKKKKWIIGFALFGLSGIFILSPTFTTESTNLFRTTSSFARIDSYQKAIATFIHNPLLGVGFNAYRYLQAEKENVEISQYENHAGSGADSSLLFAAATTGIVGLFAYVYLWYSILRNAFFHYTKYTDIFALVVICSAISLLVNSLFINSLFYPPIMFWMWMIIGLMERRI